MTAAPIIQVDRVHHRYGNGRAVLDDVSFSIQRGECVMLIGPSGAGKTTLLRLMAALESPTRGSVRVAGQDTTRLRGRALARLRQSMGIVLQDRMLLRDRSLTDNVAIPALAAGLTAAQAQQRARAALQRVGLEAQAHGAVDELSGGEQQRLALARAIVNRPAILFADEPTAHLDAANADAVVTLLASFARAGVTVVMATHAAPSAIGGARCLRVAAGKVTE